MKKKLGVVLLAAGNSNRYHGKKLLEMFHGKQMYLHILEKLEVLDCTAKVVVTQYEMIAREAERRGFHVVINENPQEGIAHSIHLGMNYLKKTKNVDGILFSVCDQPFLKMETLERLKNVFENENNRLLCAGYQGKMGNPCIIGKEYFNELMNLQGDKGGKRILLEHQEDVLILEVEEIELIDVDTREQAIYLQSKIISD
ncbi:nucleotidyltransferase family protein [Velocimicrobium porci]|uniref:Nucleotidyltransferase family protein n=1 Tax=Velocimicrobium porci TaxID=2606634 RepID=A0A6L5XVU0_9FIRM|nr:nucleotidyltransferase family protein [Velocimicrobium porci]MSS62892.1 nucleotidyltransferase family protein [Velocimicrobium porci]